jgi:hypothetical protein
MTQRRNDLRGARNRDVPLFTRPAKQYGNSHTNEPLARAPATLLTSNDYAANTVRFDIAKEAGAL